MRLLALWASVAAAVSANAGGVLRRTHLLRHQEPKSAEVDAAVKDKTSVAKFGPSNCVSTWVNEDGHCEIETKCKEQDISKYAVKFICIDAGGEKVRHVFAGGSFDTEEQFDTLIECNKCLAEKQETIEIIADTPPGAPSPAGKGAIKSKQVAKLEEDSDQLGGAPLLALRAEVKDLEGFMMNTSAELQTLNAKVYSKDFEGAKVHDIPCIGVDCDQVGKAAAPAPAAAKAAKDLKASSSSLVHHSSAHHEQEVHIEAQAARVKKIHRRHIEEDDGEDVTPRQAETPAARTTSATSSLAGALKTAEERDDAMPQSQPETSSMMLAAAAEKLKKPKTLVVALPKVKDADADDGDGDDVSEDSSAEVVPLSADDFESTEADDDVPSMSALQQGSKGDDDGADDDDSDDDSSE